MEGSQRAVLAAVLHTQTPHTLHPECKESALAMKVIYVSFITAKLNL